MRRSLYLAICFASALMAPLHGASPAAAPPLAPAPPSLASSPARVAWAGHTRHPIAAATVSPSLAATSPSVVPAHAAIGRALAGTDLRPLAVLAPPTAPGSADPAIVAERLRYAPGAAQPVRPHTEVRLITLETGTLDVQVDGPAFIARSQPFSGPLASQPTRVAGAVRLHPGDLLALSADAAYAIANHGEAPAVSVDLSLRLPQPLTPMTDARNRAGIHRERLAASLASMGDASTVMVGRLRVPPSGRAVAATAGAQLYVAERDPLAAGAATPGSGRGPADVVLLAPGDRARIGAGQTALTVFYLIVVPANAAHPPL